MLNKNKTPSLKARKSIRLKYYDYSLAGDYFVTICTHDRDCLFGEIVGGEMVLNEIGKIANECCLEITNHFPDVELDIFQIMPNHIHLILRIVGAENFLPLQDNCNRFQKQTPRSLSLIVKGSKIGVTKLCNQKNLDFKWQRNFYEHVIRNEKSYNEIYDHIELNSKMWGRDRNNPKNI